MNLNEKYNFFNDLVFFTLCNAAPAMGKFFKDSITISSPNTKLVKWEEVQDALQNKLCSTIVFNGGDVGETHVFLSKEDALVLANYAIQKRFENATETEHLDEFALNTIEEVMNILGGNMTEILSVIFGKSVRIDVPEVREFDAIHMDSSGEDMVLNIFSVHLGVGKKIQMLELAKQSYYKELVFQLKNRV